MAAVTTLKGVGPQLAKKLARLQIRQVEDLLFHLPLRYQDRTTLSPISTLRAGDEKLIQGEIQHCAIRFGRRRSLLCTIEDSSGTLAVRLFHFNRQQQSSLRQGRTIRCFGEIRWGPSGLEMVHPEYQLFHPNQTPPALEKRLTPIYPSTEGLRQRTLSSLTHQALERTLSRVEELLPEGVLPATSPPLQQALEVLHHPGAGITPDQLEASRERIALEELLAHHLSLRQIRYQMRRESATPLQGDRTRVERFLQGLPFSLTRAQQKALKRILHDLEQPHPMQQLLQGDVGSGKTIVAVAAALHAAASGLQSAIMAPTELLARQHYKNMQQLLEPTGVSIGFLSGSMGARERRAVVEPLAAGTLSILIGTHALFQREVQFHNLALVIIDEQHRFGVEQRSALKQKGVEPHQLIMTATPIPRTLAMTFYADLDSTVIDELPPGRTPIQTVTLPESRRDEVLERVRASCLQGRQAYWVCPLIEESEALQCQAASESAEEIQQRFPELSVGLVHGRMAAAEREEVMSRFHQGEIQILVATTVIEVGVDVPNASLMIIENAERLGLSQLHQLRGRVGRGSLSSSCVLIYRNPLSRIAKSRLRVIRESGDGFEIARRDLEMRGPGELLGRRQTGAPQLRIADLAAHQHLIPLVEQIAERMVEHHPERIPELIRRWIPDGERFRAIG